MVYSPMAENRGLNQAAIRSIPIFQFKKSDTKDGSERSKSFECAVCLNEFQEMEKLRIIPSCGHLFHIDCIDVWLQNNANCPLCRSSISALDINQVLAQDPNQVLFRDEDYVVIEIGSDPQTHSSTPLHFSSGEFLSMIPSPRKVQVPAGLSMGDECIVSRKKDEQFAVQPIRRSFSMDSADDRQLYLAVREMIMQQVNYSIEDGSSCSSNRVKRSFFSFRHGRGLRPLTSDSQARPLTSDSQA
ncbi:hypothetical protein F511_01654 [Dorcoceras hygrometricum]|nr:hypothetical protein F511_01654 [Dorcoceras hygrometricum]